MQFNDRDWFAMAALVGIMASEGAERVLPSPEAGADAAVRAELAYLQADAMIEARRTSEAALVEQDQNERKNRRDRNA